ncbi:MAG: ATP synthase F1 subunit delta [Oscillospiraceae bacterium]|nr:ATP synthase F1 subunit delta [Oscillospiraceae bacterium]
MTQQTVEHVYAEALFLLAQEEHQEQKIYEEINQFTDLILQYPELITLLDVPTLELPERISVLQKIIGEEQGITENFLCLLVEKRRINRISEIRNAFNKLYYEAFKIAEVFVTSAVPLEETQRTALKEKLQQKLKKNILLRESVDKSLMGGMIVQYGDTRMDNSLKGRLQAFAQQ